ncbi:hypothetical protein PI124_g21843 [Phytophthora idaei]|nr:hypothetical protein PI124_g21843 [Phytophthora idaei]
MGSDTSEFVEVLALAVLVLSCRLPRRISTLVSTLSDAGRIISGRRVYIGDCIVKGGYIAVGDCKANPSCTGKGGCMAVGDCMVNSDCMVKGGRIAVVDPVCIVKGGCIAKALFCRTTLALEPAMQEGWETGKMNGEKRV